MRVVLLQPLYMPWLGMFDMLAQSDLFIFYDDAQFSKQSWQSRNRIKTHNGVRWLSISVDWNHSLATPIRDIRVNHSANWVARNLNQIREAYRKAPYFDDYFPLIADFLNGRSEFLIDYTAGGMRLLAQLLGIPAEFEYASSYRITESQGPQKVVDICRAAGADAYLDGASGREMYDPEFFGSHGVTIHFHDYQHPVYRQLHGAFVSHLSVIDLLFNEGPNSLAIVLSGRANRLGTRPRGRTTRDG